jgi:DNA-binding NtrC family response regulator
MTDTILIVDDEDGVRRTFQEWLAAGIPDARVFAAADAAAALRIANEQPVDLAVLDWNLGSGSDGLRLLEDLTEFRPDVVAIMVTGSPTRPRRSTPSAWAFATTSTRTRT